jgi:hypothetical protein
MSPSRANYDKRVCIHCGREAWLSFINPPVCQQCAPDHIRAHNANPIKRPEPETCVACSMRFRCGNPAECIVAAPIGPRKAEGKVCKGHEHQPALQAKYLQPVRVFMPRMTW